MRDMIPGFPIEDSGHPRAGCGKPKLAWPTIYWRKQALGRGHDAREIAPPGQGNHLCGGQNGTFAEQGEEADNVQFQDGGWVPIRTPPGRRQCWWLNSWRWMDFSGCECSRGVLESLTKERALERQVRERALREREEI